MRQEDIYVGNGDGTNITALAPDENFDRYPRWSPDGSRIAFSSTKGGEGYEIHSIRADGGDLRRHTYYNRPKPRAVHFPIWEPNGRRLALTAAVGAGGQTYVIDPDGAWPTEPLKPLLTPPVPLDIRYRPWSWSQDGRRIVAYSERGAGMIVYDVATGAHEEVARVGAKPRWLSDSRRLIYTYSGALHLLDTRTRKSREIFRPSAGALIDPAVSRDDRSLYGILYRDEGSIWSATVKQ
jgi:Tol biopolymer transport system component